MYEPTPEELIPEGDPRLDEFERCADVAAAIYEQLPSELPPPEKISVERVKGGVYAVRIYEGGEIEEAFFVTVNEYVEY